ncbi:MAG TPA: hypothetical protein VGG44_06945 [Tepidisphaeraceae bacterium]|jgi:hypothetical protein
MIRRCWLGIFVICLLASGLVAKQGILQTKDGRRLMGDIQDAPDGQSVNITIHGATVSVSHDDIAQITYPADAAADFHQRLKALDPTDIKGRLDLSRWALESHEYDLAAEAAQDVQRIDPHEPNAAILLDTITSQKALDAKLSARANAAPATGAENVPAASATPAEAPSKFLTMEDVTIIRRMELLPDDQARLDFTGNVRNKYLALTGADSAAFDAESLAQQALDIFQTNDAQLIKNVRILSDPNVLLTFRMRMQPRILAGCAAAGCHGSTGSGGFFLYPDADKILVAYTNFDILVQTSRKIQGQDVFGTGPITRPMLDRLHSQSSLLLQFGLPRSLATLPHPDVRDFKPMFRGMDDPTFVEMSNWISSFNVIPPEYGIHFKLPTGDAPATQPSTANSPG